MAILLALPLSTPHLAGLEINVCEAEPDEFRIADAGEEQQFEHYQVRELARVPGRFVEGDQLGFRQQLRQSLGLGDRSYG
jgi:hypothetical protein